MNAKNKICKNVLWLLHKINFHLGGNAGSNSKTQLYLICGVCGALYGFGFYPPLLEHQAYSFIFRITISSIGFIGFAKSLQRIHVYAIAAPAPSSGPASCGPYSSLLSSNSSSFETASLSSTSPLSMPYWISAVLRPIRNFYTTLASGLRYIFPSRFFPGFNCGFFFGFSFIGVSLFGIYKAFLVVQQLLLFLPCLCVLAFWWGTMLGALCMGQQAFLAKAQSGKNNSRIPLNNSDHVTNEKGLSVDKSSGALVYPLFSLTLVLCWFLFELGRSFLFLQFPWNLTAHLFSFEDISICRMFIQIVRPCGVYLLSMLWCLFLLSFFCERSKPLQIMSTISISAVIAFGGITLSNKSVACRRSTPLLVIQPNMSQEYKLIRNNSNEILKDIVDLTNKTKKAISTKPKIIIWPETALTHLIGQKADVLAKVKKVLGNNRLIFGADRVDKKKGTSTWHNSMFIVSKRKVEHVYDKVALLPFGEYVPLRNIFPKFFNRMLDSVDCTPGNGMRQIRINDVPLFEAQICSEFMHKRKKNYNNQVEVEVQNKLKELKNMKKREGPSKNNGRVGAASRNHATKNKRAHRCQNMTTKWILQILNDGWFSLPIMWQHLAVDRLRAVEAGVPLVRVANTGISCMISCRGEVTDMISPYTRAGRLFTLVTEENDE
ncbi:MAG: apolipoprotein N-acyltransferase [Holosporales bacterium]|jgi:apolipoprotein N-acyltransferase|nr:apolipoprotein N-acyltransferase [Holosporales bacterium]